MIRLQDSATSDFGYFSRKGASESTHSTKSGSMGILPKKGIGAALLHRCLSIAKERELEKVKGIVLAENTQMLALGRKLGFEFKEIQGANEYELSMDLRKAR